MSGELYVTGQHIHAGDAVICCTHDGKVYSPPCRAGHYIGDAAEELREGLRVCVRGEPGAVYEDDA